MTSSGREWLLRLVVIVPVGALSSYNVRGNVCTALDAGVPQSVEGMKVEFSRPPGSRIERLTTLGPQCRRLCVRRTWEDADAKR